MLLKIIVPAIIGGIIGWITNVLAIKMLFRPIYPIHLPLFKLKLQGLLPKRRKEIAVTIGSTIEEELISIDEILKKISDDENQVMVLNIVKTSISDKINKKIPFLIPLPIKESVIRYVEEQIEKEAPDMINGLISGLYEKTSKKIKIGKMVEDRINQIDLIKLEEITLKIAKNELKHIEFLGGVLGALIGLIQGFAMVFFY